MGIDHRDHLWRRQAQIGVGRSAPFVPKASSGANGALRRLREIQESRVFSREEREVYMTQKTREIDYLIATKVMGHEVVSIGADPFTNGLQEGKPLGDGRYETRDLAFYSSKIEDAIQVIETFWMWSVSKYLQPFDGGRVRDTIYVAWVADKDSGKRYTEYGSTIPLAICRAALRAHGIEESAQ